MDEKSAKHVENKPKEFRKKERSMDVKGVEVFYARGEKNEDFF
jgi:hypothetical protein